MKKILSLLTLLLCVCSGAWAETETVFSATCIVTSNVSVGKGTTDQEITAAQATVTGGSMFVSNGETSDKNLLSKEVGESGNKKAAFSETNSKTFFKVVLTKALEAGDVIESLVYANGEKTGETPGLWLSTNTSRTRTVSMDIDGVAAWKNASYTVVAEDGIEGETTFYIYRGSGTSTHFTNFTITREGASKTITSKVLTGININDVSWDISGLSENAATISTAYVGAPSVEFVYTINYDDSSTKTGQTETVVATADGGNYVATSTQLTSNVTLTFTNVTVRSASDLAIASGKGTINTTVGASNYTLASGTDFTTSSDGTLSFASSIPGVAYVDAATGELQFLGAGTTTITLTQAEGSAYESGSVTFTVNVLPTACLNLGDKDAAIAQLKNGWLFDSPYFDTENKQVIIGVYAAYQTANSGFQPWIGTAMSTDGLSADKLADPANYKVGGTSTKVSWSASAPFIGSTGYYTDDGSSSKIRSANSNSSRPWSVYKFRVKGITAAQAYVQGKNSGNNAERRVTISAFEITDGALAAEAAKSAGSAGNADEVISVSELDSNKEYLIVLGNTEYASNLNVYEIAFTASASGIEIPSNRITTSAAGWASYTPMYKVSGTIYKPVADDNIANMTVYAVSAVDGSEATMSEVTVGMAPNNGYFLKGDANTTYRTTATTGSPAAPATNLIKAQTETGTVKSEGGYTRYALLTYDAENYGLYKLNSTGVTIPAGKAYLEVPVVAARAFDFLNFNFDGETTGINKVVPAEAVKDGVQKFYENGKLVIMRNGVKYNVAGAQVK